MKTEEQIRAQVSRCLHMNQQMLRDLWPAHPQPRTDQLFRRQHRLCCLLDRLDAGKPEPTVEERLAALGYV